ncbi:hypothetical protein Tco_1005616 [Tanacetum coccineum]|uniref:Uncharacterized protein n=1 Tax=Tanacetum coccineum TaxID=301880 RepID=A0ABQ5FFQ0_9ASTR
MYLSLLVKDEAVNEEMDDSLEKAVTTATGLEAEQVNGKIDKTQSKATLNKSSSSVTTLGSGLRRQETMRDSIAQTRSENVSKLSNDPLLVRGNTLQVCEDLTITLEESDRILCTTLQSRVLALETTKTTQATKIASLKKRVKKLERRHGLKRLYKVGSSKRVESSKYEGLGEEDASKQGRIADIDANEDIYLLLAELKNAKSKATTITTTPTLTTTTVTTTITAISTRPRAKRIVFHDQEQAPAPTVSSQQPSQVKVQDKVKGKMVEQEPMKKMFKKELLRLDKELALQGNKLKIEEEEKCLQRKKL